MPVKLEQIEVHVPRGPASWWPAILALDGPNANRWSSADVVARTGGDKELVRRYITRLCAAGVAQPAEVQGWFRLLRRPAQSPILDASGAPAAPTGQQQMWNAIRSLKSFNYVELAHAASTDTRQIGSGTAKTYTNALGRAGYLALLHKAKPGTPAVWRLKPSMNTGPHAPMIMRTKFVWDQNRAEVVGAAEKAAEVRP